MTDQLTATEDPRVQAGICGHVEVGGLGIEWVCVREPHGKVYRRRRRSRHGSPYETDQDQQPPRPGETVQGDRHYMVRRYSHRPVP